MTDPEIKEMKEMLEKALHKATPWANINFSHIMQALLITGLIGLFVRIETFSSFMATQVQQEKNMAEDVADLKNKINFLSKNPSFTEENFKTEMAPVRQNLETLIGEQKEIKNDLKNLEVKLEQYKTELDIIKKQE